jgi:hypothetical protein
MTTKYSLSLAAVIMAGILMTGCEGKSGETSSAAGTHSPSVAPMQSGERAMPSINPSPTEPGAIPSISAPKPIPIAEKAIQAIFMDIPRGFQVNLVDAGDVVSMQTLAVPNQEAVVHVVRRTEPAENGTWYRKDLLIINPDTRAVRTMMLMSGLTSDSYTTDSVTDVFGFLDEEHIIYVAVHGSAIQDTSYNVEKLNINTGEKTVLYERNPAHISPDFYAQGWLNDKKDTLVLPAFSKGTVDVFKLNQTIVSLLEKRFPSTWPMYSISRSPGGERFWHEGKLYDFGGHLLVDPLPEGSFRLGVSWSPDNRFSAHYYAFEDGDEHRMVGGESDIVAPQGLVISDQFGRTIQRLETKGTSTHLEIAGWIRERETAIVHYYGIDKNKPLENQRADNRYRALQLRTGNLSELEAAEMYDLDEWERVETWSPYSRFSDQIFAADLNNGKYWRSEEKGTYLGDTKDGDFLWRTIDYDAGKSVFYRLSPATKTIEQLFEGSVNSYSMLYNNWLISDIDLNYMEIGD